MSETDLNERDRIPRLRGQFRFQWEPAQNCHVLLYPEGMIKLNESAGEILACCDGVHTLAEIITELQAKYPQVEDIGRDIVEFMGVASEQKWIEFH